MIAYSIFLQLNVSEVLIYNLYATRKNTPQHYDFLTALNVNYVCDVGHWLNVCSELMVWYRSFFFYKYFKYTKNKIFEELRPARKKRYRSV